MAYMPRNWRSDLHTFNIFLLHYVLHRAVRGLFMLCPESTEADCLFQFHLFFRVHRVLSALGLSHFLCYGSLWGQIRISRSLPWEADVEFCLLNEELTKYDEVFLVRTFKKHNLQLTYNSGEGMYAVKDPAFGGASVQLIVFEEDPLVI